VAAFYGWVAVTTSATLATPPSPRRWWSTALGSGLTSAPATESIMGAIPRAKAGVGSAVSDSTRLIGGTLGVAVIGSVYASICGSHLTATMPAAVPGQVAAVMVADRAALFAVGGKHGHDLAAAIGADIMS
jgi:hypothetical protein